jgi:hypothetical protein
MYVSYKVVKWPMWQGKALYFLAECFLGTQFHNQITFPAQHFAETKEREFFPVGVSQV